MEKGSTKQEILETALELFSVQGYEATSISQIADAVGIRKASLYSHFASKQKILDALVKESLEQYDKHSIFAKTDWEDTAFTANKTDLTPDEILQQVLGHIRYILHDPQISKSRRMLTIEQFQNPDLKELQTMAAQLCLPVSVWIGLCDREPEREEEVLELAGRHIRQFFAIYGTSAMPHNA